MKPINIYDIYRTVNQRTRPERAQKSEVTQRKAVAMCEAADRIIDTPTLERVAEFRKAEELWYRSPDVSISAKCMADQFEDAIRSGDFVSVRSYYDPRGRNPLDGLLYCVKSASKPGQLKIGYTTMKLKIRLQKMETRYGIEEVRPLFAINLSFPAEIEAHAKNKLRDLLVAGKTKGDSVEWYRASAQRFVEEIVDTVEEHGTSVAEVTLFEDCPNASNVKVALVSLGVAVNVESWL